MSVLTFVNYHSSKFYTEVLICGVITSFFHVKCIAFMSVYYPNLITSLDLCSREFYNTQKFFSVLSVTMQISSQNKVSILMTHIRDLLHQYLEFVINGF